MRRQNLYILMMALCFGLGVLAQPAHAAACLSQRVHPPDRPAGHENGGHCHDQDQGRPEGNTSHTCMCLQWHMGLSGTCGSDTAKALTSHSFNPRLIIGIEDTCMARLADLMGSDRSGRYPPGGHRILPLRCPLYLQIHAILC